MNWTLEQKCYSWLSAQSLALKLRVSGKRAKVEFSMEGAANWWVYSQERRKK